jgi:hypothetical protein
MKPELNHNATGVKRPFKLEEIWRIRTRIEIQNNLMQLALLNLAIDSKLRSSSCFEFQFECEYAKSLQA